MPLSSGHDPKMPQKLAPVILLGAGGIVNDAHLPAYQIAGFKVAGIHDLDLGKARALADKFGIERVFSSQAEAVREAPSNVIYDVAVPARALPEVLAGLPEGAAVLVQKPFGENLEQARTLLALCRSKRLRAAVNFQLRFAPCITQARALIGSGAIGDVHDMEVRVTVYTPWHLWTFLEGIPRVEIVYHSMHYVDLIRSFLGEPSGIHAKTVKHPATPKLAATRSNIILDYGDEIRAGIATNHGHRFGGKYQESFVKWEGTRGVIRARLGVLLGYPQGEPDALEICKLADDGSPGPWESVALNGNWFPHGFIGTMASLQRLVAGETNELPTRVDDAFRTMAVVEAAYLSSTSGGTPIPRE